MLGAALCLALCASAAARPAHIEFALRLDATPRAVALDPQLLLLRRFEARELPPILRQVMIDPATLTVPAAARLRVALHQRMRERDRLGHQGLGLARRVAEHHALISCALLAVRAIDAPRDVGRLAVESRNDLAASRVDAARVVGVADVPEQRPHQALCVAMHIHEDRCVRRAELAGEHDEVVGHQRFACDPCTRLAREEGVYDGVGDLVGQLVRVAGGDRLRGEQHRFLHWPGSVSSQEFAKRPIERLRLLQIGQVRCIGNDDQLRARCCVVDLA
jgi:hypothetical protein